MPQQKLCTFTVVELEFMNIIWDLREATPNDVDDALRRKGRNISIGSIRNVLSIMMEKGYLSRRKEGKAYVYQAKVRRDQARKESVADLLSNMFQGSESLVVAALLENHEISPEEREKIHHLLENQDKGDHHDR